MSSEAREPAERAPIDLVRAESGKNPIEQFDADVRDALSVLTGTSRLLEQRWESLPLDRRLQMVETIARRSEELQASLLPVLARLLNSKTSMQG